MISATDRTASTSAADKFIVASTVVAMEHPRFGVRQTRPAVKHRLGVLMGGALVLVLLVAPPVAAANGKSFERKARQAVRAEVLDRHPAVGEADARRFTISCRALSLRLARCKWSVLAENTVDGVFEWSGRARVTRHRFGLDARLTDERCYSEEPEFGYGCRT